MRKLMSIFIVLVSMVLASCVSTPPVLPEKYQLSGLEQVDKIYQYKLQGWYNVDRQSLIVQTAPSRYYLIVLRTPSSELNFAEAISISSTGSQVRANFDQVSVVGQNTADIPRLIDRIYKVDGREQMNEVRAMLRGSTETTP